MPLLKLCLDGQEHSNGEVIEVLAREYRLTPDELNKMLPKASQRVFYNRVAWARAHMKMALLLENVRRGVFRITERGKAVLGESPKEINIAFLRKFPEYRPVRELQQNNQTSDDLHPKEQEIKTPAERLEDAYMSLRENLVDELLIQLKSSHPSFFEKVPLRRVLNYS